MKIPLIALAALIPALASAEDPKPYVVYQGRAVQSVLAAPSPAAAPQANTAAARQVSAFGTSAFRPGVSSGRSFAYTSAPASRGFRGMGRSSGRRGIAGSTPIGSPAPAPAPSDSSPLAYAVPGAKILTAGLQPVYSEAKGGGTHSVEGGGFIAMDDSKAHDVGRAPGITWAPPDTPPSASQVNSGGGTGASANGPTINVNNGNTNGTGNGGSGQQDNTATGTGFNPAF